MKLLTLNFLTCARKACKPHPTAFPLHPKDAELEIIEIDFNPLFLHNILPRLEWQALKTMCNELGLPGLKDEPPEPEELFVGTLEGAEPGDAKKESEGMEIGEVEREVEGRKEPSQLARDLHRLLMETCIQEGKLVCGNCGHEYAVKEGIANFLLPSHLV
jgi:multifunctional methyltransferase subunit TRM112